MTEDRARAFGDMIAAAEAAGRASLIRLGAAMAAMNRYNQVLSTIEALQEHPLDQLVRVTGESKEALIAELQAGTMDYREFYYFKMAGGKSDG